MIKRHGEKKRQKKDNDDDSTTETDGDGSDRTGKKTNKASKVKSGKRRQVRSLPKEIRPVTKSDEEKRLTKQEEPVKPDEPPPLLSTITQKFQARQGLTEQLVAWVK
jgi:hypothetical protein